MERLPRVSEDVMRTLGRDAERRAMAGPLVDRMAEENPELHAFLIRTFRQLESEDPTAAAAMAAGALGVYSALQAQLEADNLERQMDE